LLSFCVAAAFLAAAGVSAAKLAAGAIAQIAPIAPVAPLPLSSPPRFSLMASNSVRPAEAADQRVARTGQREDAHAAAVELGQEADIGLLPV